MIVVRTGGCLELECDCLAGWLAPPSSVITVLRRAGEAVDGPVVGGVANLVRGQQVRPKGLVLKAGKLRPRRPVTKLMCVLLGGVVRPIRGRLKLSPEKLPSLGLLARRIAGLGRLLVPLLEAGASEVLTGKRMEKRV